jgi:hypothetical protein
LARLSQESAQLKTRPTPMSVHPARGRVPLVEERGYDVFDLLLPEVLRVPGDGQEMRERGHIT